MLDDVDAINRRFVSLLSNHLAIAAMTRDIDQLQRPKAYVAETFIGSKI